MRYSYVGEVGKSCEVCLYLKGIRKCGDLLWGTPDCMLVLCRA